MKREESKNPERLAAAERAIEDAKKRLNDAEAHAERDVGEHKRNPPGEIAQNELAISNIIDQNEVDGEDLEDTTTEAVLAEDEAEEVFE